MSISGIGEKYYQNNVTTMKSTKNVNSTEARVMSDQETMTYTYYQNNVKPKPQTEGKKGFVCKVCGYIYEGDELPEDIICPLCKHGAVDFEPIQ